MLKFLIVTLFILGFVVVTIYFTFLFTFKVQDSSNEPTIKTNERVLINKKSYLISPPEKGDIVAYKPTKSTQVYLGRIIAEPEEKIKFQDGFVYVNNGYIEEKYLKPKTETHVGKDKNSLFVDGGEYGIPPNSYFILADNRKYALDSRRFGAINQKDIIGKYLIAY